MICDIKLLIYENIKYGITHRERLKTKITNSSSISEKSSISERSSTINDSRSSIYSCNSADTIPASHSK